MSSDPLQAAMQCDGAFPTIPSFFRENSCQRDRCGLLSFNGTNSQIVSPFASVSLFFERKVAPLRRFLYFSQRSTEEE